MTQAALLYFQTDRPDVIFYRFWAVNVFCMYSKINFAKLATALPDFEFQHQKNYLNSLSI